MSSQEDLDQEKHAKKLVSDALNTYRYLRISIVVLVVALLASVVIERTKVDGCWQGSISAYYFTPVHAVFVGTLVVIGVSLIAIKGGTPREDMLLNLAGVLAPIVAFVPTKALSHKACVSSELVFNDREAAVDNNVLAFLIGGIVAILTLIVVVRLMNKRTRKHADEPADEQSASGVQVLLGNGTLFALAILVAGCIWYFTFRESFLNDAHGLTAVAMFGVIFVVMLMNRKVAKHPYSRLYTITAGAMVAVAIGVGIAKVIDSDWRHHILYIEFLELSVFAVYWVVQTFEHWNDDVAAPPDASEGAPEGANA